MSVQFSYVALYAPIGYTRVQMAWQRNAYGTLSLRLRGRWFDCRSTRYHQVTMSTWTVDLLSHLGIINTSLPSFWHR